MLRLVALSTLVACGLGASQSASASASASASLSDFGFLDNAELEGVDFSSAQLECFASIEKIRYITKWAREKHTPIALTCNKVKNACRQCSACGDDDWTVGFGVDQHARQCVCASGGSTPPTVRLSNKDDCFISVSGQPTIENVFGNAGDDCMILATSGAGAALNGGSGDDTILLINDGSAIDDNAVGQIQGDDGDDCIYLGAELYATGFDLYAGAGNDVIFADPDREVNKVFDVSLGSGNYLDVYAGEGNDVIIFDGRNNNFENYLYGDDGDDIIRALGYVESVSGGLGDDDIVLGTHAVVEDDVYGGSGDDKVVVKSGAAVFEIIGDDGHDEITVEEGATVRFVDGGNGDDHLEIGGKIPGAVYGGDGDDYIHVAEGQWADTILAGNGNDKIVVDGYVQDDIYGGNGNNEVIVNTKGYGGSIFGAAVSGGDVVVVKGHAKVVAGGYEGKNDFKIEHGAIIDIGVYGGENDDSVQIEGKVFGEVSLGGGDDKLVVKNNANIQGYVLGGPGEDKISISSAVLHGNIYGGSDDDEIRVHSSAKVVGFVFGNAGDDFIKVDQDAAGVAGVVGGPEVDHCIADNNVGIDCEHKKVVFTALDESSSD